MLEWTVNLVLRAACLVDAFGSVFERRPGLSFVASATSVLRRLGLFLLLSAVALVAAAMLSGARWWVQLAPIAIAAGSLGVLAWMLWIHAPARVAPAIRRALRGASQPNSRTMAKDGDANA